MADRQAEPGQGFPPPSSRVSLSKGHRRLPRRRWRKQPNGEQEFGGIGSRDAGQGFLAGVLPFPLVATRGQRRPAGRA